MRYHKILALCLAASMAVCAAGGAVAETRLPAATLAKAPGAFGTLAHATEAEKGAFLPLFGNWFDTTTPGWGLDIQRVGDLLFVVWFIYRADGTPIWYVAVGTLTDMSWTGNIDVFSWNAGTQTATPTSVGTMTIVWSDDSNAAVTWTLNGNDGGANIEFAAFAPGSTLANMTGHYFPFFTPGWGFTLLTQGDVTVMTMYFYKNGEPIWAQGVTTTAGFSPSMIMNYFFSTELCPECLSRKSVKSLPTVQGLGEINPQYNPGLPSDVAVQVDAIFSNSPILDPFEDIEVFVNYLGTSSGITGAYQDNFDEDYGGLTDQLPTCVEIKTDPGAWQTPPVNTNTFTMRYFHNVPQNGYFDVYDDANCTTRWRLPGPDQQMHDVGLAASFTGEDALQLRFGAMIPNVFDNGTDSCDQWFGVSFYGAKQATLDGPNLTELAIQGTGAAQGDVFFCTDNFRDYLQVGISPTNFANQEFLEDPEDFSQLELRIMF